MNYPFKDIKKYYKEIEPLILKEEMKWYYIYSFRWMSIFSPIEIDAWDAIRHYGKVPFYPQYPVDRFFLDFGNPYLKIGIECDGKEFHKNKLKDLNRDKILAKLGWTIYRISGSDCKRKIEGYEERYRIKENEDRKYVIEGFYHDTIDGLIQAIGIYHCGFNGWDLEKEELRNVCKRALSYRVLVMPETQIIETEPPESRPIRSLLTNIERLLNP